MRTHRRRDSFFVIHLICNGSVRQPADLSIVNRIIRILLLSFFVSVPVACTETPEPPQESEAPAPAGMAAATGPDTLAARPPVDLGGPGMDNLRAHLDSIEGLGGERLEGVRETHSELIRSMLVKVMTDLSGLVMVSGDLQAAVQEVREDWERLPTLGTEELEAFFPDHLSRVRRLMELHRQRMAEAHMG